MSLILANLIIALTLFFFISWIFISLIVYFIPVIVAYIRKHKNIFPIFLLTVFLGWTFVGWLASLLWALNSDTNQNDD